MGKLGEIEKSIQPQGSQAGQDAGPSGIPSIYLPLNLPKETLRKLNAAHFIIEGSFVSDQTRTPVWIKQGADGTWCHGNHSWASIIKRIKKEILALENHLQRITDCGNGVTVPAESVLNMAFTGPDPCEDNENTTEATERDGAGAGWASMMHQMAPTSSTNPVLESLIYTAHEHSLGDDFYEAVSESQTARLQAVIEAHIRSLLNSHRERAHRDPDLYDLDRPLLQKDRDGRWQELPVTWRDVDEVSGSLRRIIRAELPELTPSYLLQLITWHEEASNEPLRLTNAHLNDHVWMKTKQGHFYASAIRWNVFADHLKEHGFSDVFDRSEAYLEKRVSYLPR